MNKPKCKIDSSGDKEWFLNDKRHRTDGPAIELVDGYKAWWLNGEYYCSAKSIQLQLYQRSYQMAK